MGGVSAMSHHARMALSAVALTVTVTVAGCSGSASDTTTPSTTSESSGPGASPDGNASPSETATSNVSGIATTPSGTTLKLGQPAMLYYAPNPTHQSVIKVTVDKLQHGKLQDLRNFRLSDAARRSSVYYATARVKNTGDGDLGGQPLQLYGKVSNDLVVPPVILGATFHKCDYEPLPAPFTHGDRTTLCVLLLAPHHGKVPAVQWRPADDSKPITWTTHR
jgi:hypothetical protein